MGVPERGEEIVRNNISRNNACRLSTFDEHCLFTESRSTTESKKNRHSFRPRYIIVNLLRNEKVLKEAREKCFIKFRVITKNVMANFTLKAIEVRSQWDAIFKVLKEKNCQ